uniref:Transposase (Putative), gypsy type n=1 Tax=Tanacetum cinerariifolium TaxID=118510 RepID=A0A6L2N213_TANCI|nr:hypothetical protein [Tanacetum cinerariifolium]
MDLFLFIRHSDPTKVRIGERKPAKREVKLLTLTEGGTIRLNPPILAALGDSGDSIDKLFDEENDDVPEKIIAKDVSKVVAEKTKKKQKRKVVGDASGSTFPPKRLREDHHAAASNTGVKSLAAIRDLVPDGLVFRARSRNLLLLFPCHLPRTMGPQIPSPVADVPVTTVAVTTTVTVNASTVPPPKVRVVSKNLEIFRDSASVGGANADAAGTLKLNEPTDSSDSFYASQSVCVSRLDRSSCSACFFLQLRAIDYDQIYAKFNVGATQQICLEAEVRMRAKHTLEQKDRLEDKCSEQTAFLSERDTKIAHLKSLFFLKEADAAKAICLREKDVLFEKVKTLESATALKETELTYLAAQVAQLTSELSGFQLSCDELSSKVASLESERDSLVGQKSSLESAFEFFRERVEATQDEQAKVLEYCHALGQAIGCADNKAKYVEAVNALGTVDFSLLFELKSKKDASIVDLMDSLCLEGPLAEIPRAEDLQPSPKQLRLPIHRLEDNVVLGETSLSFSLQVVHSRVQRVRGEIMEKRLSLTDVMVPLAEPLSSRSLIGKASTSAAPATSEPITTLSTTFASSDVVPPLSISNDQVLHNEGPPVVTFEK